MALSNLLPVYDKVAASGYAGLISTILVAVLGLFHITLPAAVIAAIVTLVMFLAGYLRKETKLGADVAKIADELARNMAGEGPKVG